MIIDKDELTPFERFAMSMNYARSLLAWPPGRTWANITRDYIKTKDGGFWQLIPPGPMPEPRELTPDEQREAAQHYIQERYGKSAPVYMQTEAGTWSHIGYADVDENTFKPTYRKADNTLAFPSYNAMIRRETDGSDPLVDEPGP